MRLIILFAAGLLALSGCGSGSGAVESNVVGQYLVIEVDNCPQEWSGIVTGGVLTVVATGSANQYGLTYQNSTLAFISYDGLTCTMESQTGFNDCTCVIQVPPNVAQTDISGSCQLDTYPYCNFQYQKE